MSDQRHQQELDVTGVPEAIEWRTSQRMIVLNVNNLPIRAELARLEVPIGQMLITRRIWQLMTIAVEGLPAPQTRQVTDPSYLELLRAAGAAPQWHLVWRRFDDDEQIPPFPDDQPLPTVDEPPKGEPAEGWSFPGGRLLFPWGSPSDNQRIVTAPQGALSLYLDINEEAADSFAVVGGMLQGESRLIVPKSADFWAWYARR